MTQARWKILTLSAPSAFILPERQDQFLALGKEAMVEPVLSVLFAIERCALDVNVLVSRIKVDVANGGSFPSQWMGNVDGLKERRGDEVYVLTGIGEETHHRESNKSTHSTTVVVSGQAIWCDTKERRNVEV